jgi:hypothetical protein
MEYTWEQLHKMRVAELRTIAEQLNHPEIQGYSTMHKEILLPLLCRALGIEAHAHHEVVGVDKTAIKREIRLAKQLRDEALKEKDKAKLKEVRHQIHILKGRLRRATV